MNIHLDSVHVTISGNGDEDVRSIREIWMIRSLMDKEYSRRLENVSKKYESSSVKESGDTIGDVFSSLVMLPMLRGLWTFSCVDNSGNVYDNAFQGRTLTNTSSATFADGI